MSSDMRIFGPFITVETTVSGGGVIIASQFSISFILLLFIDRNKGSGVTVAFMDWLICHNILKICQLSSSVCVEHTKSVLL